MNVDLKDKSVAKYLIPFITSSILFLGCFYYLKNPDKELSNYLCNAFFITGTFCELIGLGVNLKGKMMLSNYVYHTTKNSYKNFGKGVKNRLPWILVGLGHIAIGIILSYTL